MLAKKCYLICLKNNFENLTLIKIDNIQEDAIKSENKFYDFISLLIIWWNIKKVFTVFN